ncbi:hypothetical protein DH2020_008831 [Rehmannia glutinosa]|uniref:Farnesyl pyrophosphate synthase n=1 Tax=Rehmannia glutinosa TaxID=99300 RepID=A0ABR0X4I7_REHGL
MANLNGTTSDLRSVFLGVYSVLKSELLNDPAFEWTDDSRQWVDRKVPSERWACVLDMAHMLDYNVPGGKLNRGLSVIDSYKLLKELQAYFLVLDDIMDSSHTGRGQPCWFRVPKVEFQTAAGQMIDLITTIEGEKDLSKYSLPLYCVLNFLQSSRIVQYKTAYYSFYLPVACALLMYGENLDNHVNVKNVLIDGNLLSSTDIEDFKCSWLVEHYGKANPADVAKVKAVYNDINLKVCLPRYEPRATTIEITSSIDNTSQQSCAGSVGILLEQDI